MDEIENASVSKPKDHALRIVLTRNQCRLVDQIAIQEYGMPGIVLMENAGRGCAAQLLSRGCTGGVVICCGQGNNGGDGYVIARHLLNANVPTKVILFFPIDKLTGDALINFRILEKMQMDIQPYDEGLDDAQLTDVLSTIGNRTADWIVDALLGTGAVGPPRPPLDRAIAAANRSAGRRMAIDLPSGLDCDTGQFHVPTFRADVTCTFIGLKPGFERPQARALLGQLEVIDIGVPKRVLDQVKDL